MSILIPLLLTIFFGWLAIDSSLYVNEMKKERRK